MSKTSQTVLTPNGYKKIEEEFEYLKVEKRKEIAERIKIARGFGDLSENAEYTAAKEEQAKMETRIAELKKILENAVYWAKPSHGPKPSLGHYDAIENVKDKFAGMDESLRKHTYIKD